MSSAKSRPQTLRRMFVQRASAHIDGTHPSKVGVLLVGHGQPDEWDVEWPTETEQEIGFRQAVLEDFERAGYRPENLSLASGHISRFWNPF